MTQDTTTQEQVQMTLVALDSEELNAFVNQQKPQAKFALVPKSTLVDNPSYIEVVPFLSLASFNPNDGLLTFVVKQIAEKVEGVDTLKETYVGLNALITNKQQITCETMVDREDGVRVYDIGISNLITTSIEAIRAFSVDLLGFDLIEKFALEETLKTTVRYTFFRNNAAEDTPTERLRMGVSVPLTLTAEVFNQISDALKEKQTDAVFSQLALNAGQILQSFDISEVASNTINNMKDKERIDAWSVQVVSQRMLEYFELMRSNITYHDLISAVQRNVAAQRASIEANLEKATGQQGEVIEKLVEAQPAAAADVQEKPAEA